MNKPNKEQKLAGAYVPEEKYEALKELARRNHRSLADQIRCLIDQALEKNGVELESGVAA